MSRPEQLRLPDELMSAAPIPFGKAQKPAGAKRRTTARILKAAAWCLALFVICVAAFRVMSNAMVSRRFLVAPGDIKIEGNHFVSREEVLVALGFPNSHGGGTVSMFRVNLALLRARLEAIPWDASAAITRIFPNHLLISIKERAPVAFAAIGGQLELVDRDGVLLRPPTGVNFDFPVLDGLNQPGSAAARAAQIQPYLGFMASTHDEAARSGWIIAEVNVGDASDLRALLVQGPETVVADFGDTDYLERFKNFAMLAPQVLASYPRVESIDLRYRGEVVVDPASALAISPVNQKANQAQ